MASLILFEARELRRKQDARLDSCRRTAVVVFAWYLSVWPVAVALTPAPASTSLRTTVLLSGAAILGFVALTLAATAQLPIRAWEEGPEVEFLVSGYYSSTAEAHELERDLALLFAEQYSQNESRVHSVGRRLLGDYLRV